MLTLKNASGYALGRPLAVNVPSSPARPIPGSLAAANQPQDDESPDQQCYQRDDTCKHPLSTCQQQEARTRLGVREVFAHQPNPPAPEPGSQTSPGNRK